MTETIHLKKIQMFSQLPDEALEQVRAVLEAKSLASGEILFNLDDPGDELYIVQKGRVAIFMPSEEKPGQEQPIRIFADQEALGWLLRFRKTRSSWTLRGGDSAAGDAAVRASSSTRSSTLCLSLFALPALSR